MNTSGASILVTFFAFNLAAASVCGNAVRAEAATAEEENTIAADASAAAPVPVAFSPRDGRYAYHRYAYYPRGSYRRGWRWRGYDPRWSYGRFGTWNRRPGGWNYYDGRYGFAYARPYLIDGYRWRSGYWRDYGPANSWRRR